MPVTPSSDINLMPSIQPSTHLRLKQQRPVVEHSSDVRVIGPERFFPDSRHPRVQGLCFSEVPLGCVKTGREHSAEGSNDPRRRSGLSISAEE